MAPITVEVIYIATSKAPPFQRYLTFSQPTTASQAIEASGVRATFSELAQENTLCLGIFSEKVEPDHILKNGDRLEIYRPLTITPMEKRRLLAQRR